MKGYEVNFDGLVGPTHNFSGLSFGNLHSMKNKDLISNPKKAALQSLQKIKTISGLGRVQGILPPHERPHIPTLKNLGFSGKDEEIIQKAYSQAPDIFFASSSSAAMWTANAATITPSQDSEDGKVHLTAANLASEFHRSIESDTTSRILKKIFKDPLFFTHHDPLPANPFFPDEGAANHMRFFKTPDDIGLHVFVYGKSAFQKGALSPVRYPARQTLEASQAIARNHKIFKGRFFFLQQNPIAIDEGVFHNDVISTSNGLFFLFHEKAFLGSSSFIKELHSASLGVFNEPIIAYEVKEKKVPLKEAVKTYLFNSQIIENQDGLMTLVAPLECRENARVHQFLDHLTKDQNNPIEKIIFVDVSESLLNGGGPACLRLRISLKKEELESIPSSFLLSETLFSRLTGWVNKHYRDKLSPKDLADPLLLKENQEALDELTKILGLGSFYSFQK